jgi:putative ABC transport system substrate-binding protein
MEEKRCPPQTLLSAKLILMLPLKLALLLLLTTLTVGVQLLIAQTARADTVAVLYPEIREPYRQLFLSIIDGVRASYRGEVVPYEIAANSPDTAVSAWIAEHHVDAVIALGNRGAAALPTLPPTLPAVMGAVLLNPDHQQWGGISLAPNPRRLLTQLQQLQPEVRTVYVIYPPGPGTWLLDRARAAARELHLELVELPADGVQALAQRYRDVLTNMRRDRDALWIAHDGRGLDSALLEQLLETAWERRLLVFSSNLVDVKRGALFALYPDNEAMGQQLGLLVARVQRDRNAMGGIEPADSLLSAVNMRTADHLGLSFSAAIRQRFSLMFPEPVH